MEEKFLGQYKDKEDPKKGIKISQEEQYDPQFMDDMAKAIEISRKE